MIKYFISYKNLINDNTINKKIDIHSPELKMLKKTKNGEYKEIPILYFVGYVENLLSFIDKIENRKPNISFMVELTSGESKKLNNLFIKKYEITKENNLKLIKDNKEIELLNFNVLMNLKPIEAEKCKIVILTKEKKDFTISSLDKTFINGNLLEKRKNLKKDNMINDLYFYTEDEELIEKYKEKTILLKKINEDKYQLLKHKIFIIDSISQDRISDLTSNTFRCLYELCNSSIQVFIKEEDEEYEILSEKIDNSKKGYLILLENFESLLYNYSIEPILKYINVYELENRKYIKKPIEEYMKENDILKYIKKPSQN